MVTIGHSSWARGLTIRHLDLALFVSPVTNGDLEYSLTKGNGYLTTRRFLSATYAIVAMALPL